MLVADTCWTQRVSVVLRIAPSDMSNLIRGKVARISQERLESFLNHLDIDVHIRSPEGRTQEGSKHYC